MVQLEGLVQDCSSSIPNALGLLQSCTKPSTDTYDIYMGQYNVTTLVQIMACRLFGGKPLSDPMPYDCQLDPKEQNSMKFIRN